MPKITPSLEYFQNILAGYEECTLAELRDRMFVAGQQWDKSTMVPQYASAMEQVQDKVLATLNSASKDLSNLTVRRLRELQGGN